MRKIIIILFLTFISNGFGTNFYCTTCITCNSDILSSSRGDTIFLDSSISNQNGDCINILNKENITFDCQNYSNYIQGDGDATGDGIHLTSSNNSIIKNCNISEFAYGINSYHSNHSLIESNEIFNNNNGIYNNPGLNNTINLNRIYNNGATGVYLDENSNFNTISSNIILNHTPYGIYIVSGSNNIINSNTINYNDEGIFLKTNSTNNTINENYLNNTNVNIYFFESFGEIPKNNTIINNHILNITSIDANYNISSYNNLFENNYYTSSQPYCYSSGIFSFCDLTGHAENIIISSNSKKNIFPFSKNIVPIILLILFFII